MHVLWSSPSKFYYFQKISSPHGLLRVGDRMPVEVLECSQQHRSGQLHGLEDEAEELELLFLAQTSLARSMTR